MLAGSRLEVESVCRGSSVKAFYAGDPCYVLKLVDYDRIDHEQAAAEFIVELFCHLDAEHG